VIAPYYVLIDSSVWIDYFRHGNHPHLEALLKEDLVCTNELVLTELLPFLEKGGHKDAISALLSLPNIELEISWPTLRKYQVMNLEKGINKVGIPDLIILQQVIENKLTLYSTDRHFLLMQKHLNFDLI